MMISLMKDLTNTENFNIGTISTLANFITNNNWSPAVFKFNTRRKENFIHTDLIVLDVDDGPNINEALELFKDYKLIIAPTKSHQIEKNGIIRDRYRVVLFLEGSINNDSVFSSTWQSVYKKFPFIDKACKDSSRFFYKSKSVHTIKEFGNTVSLSFEQPKKYDNTVKDMRGFYPPSYLYAKNWGVPVGRRNDTVFRISCELFRCGYIEDEIIELINAITDLPDYEVVRTVKSAGQAVLK